MRGFFSFFFRYHFALLFIVLQIINLVLIVSYNQQQRTVFINSSNHVVGSIEEKTNRISEYLDLKEENQKLLEENARLRNHLPSNYRINTYFTRLFSDSVLNQKYDYKACKVIQSSIFKTRNYLTINIGKNQGVKKSDAVISPQGVVGIIKKVGKNYSVVLPIINNDFNLSCKIGKKGYFGSLVWEGENHRTATLNDIPLHVELHQGDSLFTTGYSLIFPSEIFVGKIDTFEKISGESFYHIRVNLSVDFQKIQSVYVISNLFKGELNHLLNQK